MSDRSFAPWNKEANTFEVNVQNCFQIFICLPYQYVKAPSTGSNQFLKEMSELHLSFISQKFLNLFH